MAEVNKTDQSNISKSKTDQSDAAKLNGNPDKKDGQSNDNDLANNESTPSPVIHTGITVTVLPRQCVRHNGILYESGQSFVIEKKEDADHLIELCAVVAGNHIPLNIPVNIPATLPNSYSGSFNNK